MKKKILLMVVFLSFIVVGISAATVSASDNPTKMKVTSTAIKDGKIDKKYGMYGSQKNKNGVPLMSIPFIVKNAPKNTKFYAVYMYDNNVPWVHWLVVNYKSDTFIEDASRKKSNLMVQGRNSFGTVGYGGPTPPDKTHTYTIKVYALKSKVSLSNGFSYNQFIKATNGKILSTAIIKGKYVK